MLEPLWLRCKAYCARSRCVAHTHAVTYCADEQSAVVGVKQGRRQQGWPHSCVQAACDATSYHGVFITGAGPHTAVQGPKAASNLQHYVPQQ